MIVVTTGFHYLSFLNDGGFEPSYTPLVGFKPPKLAGVVAVAPTFFRGPYQTCHGHKPYSRSWTVPFVKDFTCADNIRLSSFRTGYTGQRGRRLLLPEPRLGFAVRLTDILMVDSNHLQ